MDQSGDYCTIKAPDLPIRYIRRGVVVSFLKPYKRNHIEKNRLKNYGLLSIDKFFGILNESIQF